MLGDISPQTARIDYRAVVYPGRDHVVKLVVDRFDGRKYAPVDLSALTRAVLVFPGTDPVIAYDSLVVPAVFAWAGSTLTIDLSDYSMPQSTESCYLIVYDVEHPAGQVLVDDNETRVQFDFRNVSATGIVQPPVVELVGEAPVDGETYGRKDAAWVSLAALVTGVVSVNGHTGVVVLDATDVGADAAGTAAGAVAAHVALPDPHPQYFTESEGDARYERGLVAGANITIDRTNPAAPVISATGGGGGGAVDSVNGHTGVVVLDATDVGADAAGTAAGAVAAHVALPDPHPQYATDDDVVNARFQSTGLISGGAMTINGGDNTKFNVAAGVAVFADYTDPAESLATILPFGPLTAVAVPNLATANVSYIGLNSAGTIVQQTTRFTNTQRRSIVSLGAVIHSNRTNLNAVNTIVSANRQLLSQFGDGMRAIGQLNLGGNVYSPVGASLQIQRSAGELFSPGANFHVNPDDPHAAVLGAVSPATFRYRLANGTEYTDRTTIDPANYDVAGVLTAAPANRYTVQLIAVFQSGITRLQYGQALYNSMADAVAAAQAQAMVLEQNIAENGVVRGYLAVKGDATDLTNSAQAVFINLSKFSAASAVAPLTLSTTDELSEGSTNLYFTVVRVRNSILTGLSVATNIAITAADTVLDALGKLQAQITGHFGAGGTAHANAVAAGAAGFMAGADKTKLDGVATGATANSSDATLLARANHTGTQATSTVTGLDAALAKALYAPVLTESTTSRVLALTDGAAYIRHTNASASTVTIPPQSAVTWLADTEVHIRRAAAGNLTLTPGSGVTLNAPSGGTLVMTNNMSVTLKRVASDVWDVIGQTVPV